MPSVVYVQITINSYQYITGKYKCPMSNSIQTIIIIGRTFNSVMYYIHKSNDSTCYVTMLAIPVMATQYTLL